MIGVSVSGDSKKTSKSLSRLHKDILLSDLHRYGERGVEALTNATPVDTGLTAKSWGYRIIQENTGPRIEWYNRNIVNGTSVVILIQYGHGTGTGGYVVGRDFINPSIQPVFDSIVDEIWKKVNLG